MSATCVDCARELAPNARFCGACGTLQPEPVEDPDALARYRTALARFAEDGPLESRELAQLETLRVRLGLALGTHERLIGELATIPPMPSTLALAIDPSTIRHFEVASRCMLRLRVENRGDLALETLAIHPLVRGSRPPELVTMATLFPGSDQVAALWMVPQVAGFHELGGVLHAVDLLGEPAYYGFEKVLFRVGPSGQGPAISVVNIDQRSARVVDNSRSAFAAPSVESGGLVADGEWQTIPLTPLSRARALAMAPSLRPRIAEISASSTRIDDPSRPGSPDQGPTPASGPAAAASGQASAAIDLHLATERAQYHMTSVLARGDLATIYGGRRGDGALVAVKIADDFQDNDLLQSEIRALEMLRAEPSPQHKHLPEALDRLRTSDGRLGTVFARIDGYDLYSLRERLPQGIPARHIVWILRRCLSALGWAHAHGVLHGNLEPAHIMVRPHDHNVWLVDWCYAIINPAGTGQGFRCLNEEYSPPEVAQRRPPLPASDLYSLGKCMFYALGGDPAAKRLPDDLDERLARFLRFFVQESPLGRAQDAWDMYSQLDRLRQEIYGAHEFVPFEV